MIFINKNSINKVVLTLCESSRLTNSFYLFEFKNEYILNSVPIYYYTPNLSTNKSRYDLFNISESSLGSSNGGMNVPISLIAGQYRYNIYESSAATITLSATTGVVIETGRMIVNDNIDSTIIVGQPNNIYL